MNPTPHDSLIRAIFGQPEHALSELAEVLPAPLFRALDPRSLAPLATSFLDEELRASAADLAFAARFRDGQPARLLFLIEHQSTPDRRMPLRLLSYQARLLEDFAASHPAETTLPCVIALLIHQGPKRWPWPASFLAATGGDRAIEHCGGLRPLDFDFLIDDLATFSDAALLSRGRDVISKLTWIALRHGRDGSGLVERMVAAFHALERDLRGPGVVPALARLVRYVLDVSEEPPAVVRRAFAMAVPTESRSPLMKWSEALRVEGRVEGRVEACRENLRDLLSVRFGAIEDAIDARIAIAEEKQLRAWLRRVVIAANPREVFEPQEGS